MHKIWQKIYIAILLNNLIHMIITEMQRADEECMMLFCIVRWRQWRSWWENSNNLVPFSEGNMASSSEGNVAPSSEGNVTPSIARKM